MDEQRAEAYWEVFRRRGGQTRMTNDADCQKQAVAAWNSGSRIVIASKIPSPSSVLLHGKRRWDINPFCPFVLGRSHPRTALSPVRSWNNNDARPWSCAPGLAGRSVPESPRIWRVRPKRIDTSEGSPL